MNIASVQIQNFRGIKRLDLELRDVTVLIGENNTGKTTVLDALKLTLSHLGLNRTIFQEMDFHLPSEDATPSSAEPIIIDVILSDEFTEPWGKELIASLSRAQVLQVAGNDIHRVHLRLKCGFDHVSGEFSHKWLFLDENRSEFQPGVVRNGITVLRRELHYYYLGALRDVSRHFDAKGPFWRPFLKDSQLSQDRKSEIESRLKEVNDLIVSSHGSFDQVKKYLRHLQSLVPLGSDSPVSIEAIPSRSFEVLSKAQVQIGATTGAKIPLALHGEGTQSLAVLILFFAFLESQESGTSILALEEPEAHLHPSAIRVLWKILKNFATQRLISTHSGELIAEINIREIRRLAQTPDGIQTFCIGRDVLSTEEVNKFNYHIRRTRGELLFARCWLLVEGQSDILVYEAAARACELDLHKEGVRLVEFAQSDISTLAKVANALGIAWYCVGDNDRQKVKVENALRKACGGTLEEGKCEFPYPNLECHLASNGFKDVYSLYMKNQGTNEIKLKPDEPGYWEKFIDGIQRGGKTKAAADIALKWTQSDSPSVTPEIRSVLEKAIVFAGGDTGD